MSKFLVTNSLKVQKYHMVFLKKHTKIVTQCLIIVQDPKLHSEIIHICKSQHQAKPDFSY